jgi:hypothetical protein
VSRRAKISTDLDLGQLTFCDFFELQKSIGFRPPSNRQAMRGKSEKSPRNPHFSPSSQRIRLYSGAVEIERGLIRDFLETVPIFP